MKRNYFALTLILLTLLIKTNPIFGQECKPTSVSEDGKLEFYGGKIRDGLGLFTDDQSAYSFYVVQIDKGKNGNIAFVSFYESLEDRTAYNAAINDYLNNDKLKTSYLEIEVGNMVLTIPTTNCTLVPKSTSLGSLYGYTVNFEGAITKSQVSLLQKSDIKNLRLY